MKVTTLLGGSSLLLSTVMLARAFAEPQGDPANLLEAAGAPAAVENAEPQKPAKPMIFSRMFVNENGDTVSVEYSRDAMTGTITRKELITGKDGKTIEHGSTTVKEGNTANTTAYTIGPDGKKVTTQATTTREAGVRTTKEVTTRPNGETVTRQATAKKEGDKVVEHVEGSSSDGKTWNNTVTRPQVNHPVNRPPRNEAQAENRPAEVRVMKAPANAPARMKPQAAPHKDEHQKK